MEVEQNKAPGTQPRPQGYTGPEAETQSMFLRRAQVTPQVNLILTRGANMSRFMKWMLFGVVLPMICGGAYINWQLGREWYDTSSEKKRNVWFRRNQKDFEQYMTQRPNTQLELLGLKSYNIGGDDNDEATGVHVYEKSIPVDKSRIPGFVQNKDALESTIRRK